jgi:hypothetical protein
MIAMTYGGEMDEEHHGQEQRLTLTPRSRPWQVAAAVLLMVPAALGWGVASVGFVRLNADDGVAPLVLFAIPGGLALFAMSVFGLAGLYRTWRGQRAGCATVLPGIAMILVVVVLVLGAVRSLAPGRRTGTTNTMDWEPTMAVPITIAALSIASLMLLRSRAARDWFPPAPQRPGGSPSADR